jgi:hypothetical protein
MRRRRRSARFRIQGNQPRMPLLHYYLFRAFENCPVLWEWVGLEREDGVVGLAAIQEEERFQAVRKRNRHAATGTTLTSGAQLDRIPRFVGAPFCANVCRRDE